MKLLEFINKNNILVDLKAVDKKGVLEELSAPLASSAGLSMGELVRVLMERERLGSTGIGGGIGIPHGKLKKIDNLLMGFGLSRRGVAFDSIDGKPAHLFFVLITPENSTGLHLKVLARISRLLKNEIFKERLKAAVNPEQVIQVLSEEDEDF
jgi:PTS system nitrogen regulatory IIA component